MDVPGQRLLHQAVQQVFNRKLQPDFTGRLAGVGIWIDRRKHGAESGQLFSLHGMFSQDRWQKVCMAKSNKDTFAL
ncbi:hypothetical protein [Streptomyces murinus]|uniref:hypothetical protein n=1 Tax=Streptomyces murinus TaxID=33900 RepID=UPI00381158F6